MTRLHNAPLTAEALEYYRAECVITNGWAVFRYERSFVPAHRIYVHPEDGPVILIVDAVFEVDPDVVPVFNDEESAREAFWKDCG